MVNINNRGREVIIDENEIHKISCLPMYILEIIFKDMEFFEEISGNIGLTAHDFCGLIDNILSRHVGSIVMDLDHWLLCVTNIINFIVKPPSPKVLFPNLLGMTLMFIKFHPAKANYVLNSPLLSSLTFIACNSIHFLTISAPRIEFLTIHDSQDIRAIFFENFSNVRELLFREEFKTYYKKMEVHYMLQFVELREFEGTLFELIFLKLILAYSPSLSRMIVDASDELDVAKVLGVYEDLMMSFKASPRVKVIVAPHGQDV
ncbi:hypothetical protein H5410_027283 [Solanum commersonii]|uniref:FBD domain-containing protein n=1 Tax=Solanum commersonii TaxID=4109 RepID=A0A9J5Z1J5_SOLCO|nr:hypothetical protein H5410_027283 [Solanum commersonii]